MHPELIEEKLTYSMDAFESFSRTISNLFGSSSSEALGHQDATHDRRSGMIGNTTCEGRARSMCTRLVATLMPVDRPSGSPVFGFTSKCGKLLLETSNRIRCPRLKRLHVGNASILMA